MKTGFPKHMSIITLFNEFRTKQEFNMHTSNNPKEFYSKLLRACHLKRNDYEIGNTQIFFRLGKFELLVEQLKINSIEILHRLDKLDNLRRKLKIFIIFVHAVARFLVIRNKNRTNLALATERPPISLDVVKSRVDSREGRTRKKIKLDTQNGISKPASTQILGNARQDIFCCIFSV